MKVQSFPNAFTIVIAFIFLAGILTYIIPKGKYDRVLDPRTNREIVVPGSYKQVDAENLSPFEILTCIPRGIINGGEVVVLIFFVGGCLFIVERTGALKAGVSRLSSLLHGYEEWALILAGILFAIGGATSGLQEEIIPLIPILLILTRTLGYPPIITIAVSYGAAAIGSAFSPVNAFGAVIAQKVADVPFLTGAGFRMGTVLVAFAFWMFLTIRYGNKHRLVKATDEIQTTHKLSNAHSLILIVVLLAFALLIYGMLALDWGFNQISAEFFVVAILVGLVAGMGINKTFVTYAEGFKELTFAGMIVGLAYGISLVLKEGLIIDTIIYGLFTPLQHVPPVLSSIGMMASQALLHIVVPSYSGQAVLTMPILAPLSDLIGLSRDVCVMAFQFGAILMDLIIPTNGALMAVIAMAGISYNEWAKFLTKRLLLMYVLCIVILSMANVLGL